MSAALHFATEGEEVPAGAHPIDADGMAGREELARACAEIWLAALRTYYADAQAVMRGIKTADPGALEDLTFAAYPRQPMPPAGY